MNNLLIVIEKTETGYSAFCPDVPGVVATGRRKSEVEKNLQEALSLHMKGLAAEHIPFKVKTESYSKYIPLTV